MDFGLQLLAVVTLERRSVNPFSLRPAGSSTARDGGGAYCIVYEYSMSPGKGLKVTLHSSAEMPDSPPALEGLNVRDSRPHAYHRDQRAEKRQRLGVESFSLRPRAVSSVRVIFQVIELISAIKVT